MKIYTKVWALYFDLFTNSREVCLLSKHMIVPKVSRWLSCLLVCGCFIVLGSIGGWGRTMARLSWQSIGAFVKCAERLLFFCAQKRDFFSLIPLPSRRLSQKYTKFKKSCSFKANPIFWT